MNIKRLILLPLIVALTSCASERYIMKDAVAMVGDAVLIEPIANIYYFDEKSNAELDDALSKECANHLNTAFGVSRFPTYGAINLAEESELGAACIEEINRFQSISKIRKKDVFMIPECLDMLLENHGRRYGLVVLGGGFERDQRGYRKAMLGGLVGAVISTVLSLGTYTAINVPNKYFLETWVAVLDSETDRVIFFNHIGEEASPINPVHVMKHVGKHSERFRK